MAAQQPILPVVQLQQFATGFARPVDIAHCGDDRLFVVEQLQARIWILDKNGNKLPTPFLNLGTSAVSNGNEQGLLGLAFHPNYAQNGHFYINLTKPNADTRVSRYTVSATDPNLADPASELLLFEVDQPYSNHNGGGLKFGPDGYLYIGLGDGGSGGDPQANGQKRTTFLGKMLRIDVDNGSPYGIPPSNPFVSDPNTLDEIWALGLRNPWRYSFDRLTGDLWIGDVGQNAWEEVDFQPANSPGGENYGWRCNEGNHDFNTTGCLPDSVMTFPVVEYVNDTECSVTGGFVYRGFNYPQLYGRYLYTDYCTGKLWSITPDSVGGWTNTQLADLINGQLASFGENKNGELFVLGNSNGIVYRVTETTESWAYTVNVMNPPCPGTSDGVIQLVFPANIPIPPVTWSDGATGSLRTDLPAGTYTATIIGSNGSVATETVVFAPTVSLSTVVSDETCPGSLDGAIGIVVLGTQGGTATAVWSDGATGLERIELAPGPYSVTVNTAEGCVFTEDFNVVTLLPSPIAVIEAVGDTLNVVGGDFENSYQWLLGGVPIAGANDTTFAATESGTYSLVVVDDLGCTGTSNALFVEFTATNTIPELTSVRVTPNPFSQSIRLEVVVSEPVFLQMSITDLQGKTLLTERLAVSSATTRDFDLGKIPAGAYLLILKNGKGEWVERLVRR